MTGVSGGEVRCARPIGSGWPGTLCPSQGLVSAAIIWQIILLFDVYTLQVMLQQYMYTTLSEMLEYSLMMISESIGGGGDEDKLSFRTNIISRHP